MIRPEGRLVLLALSAATLMVHAGPHFKQPATIAYRSTSWKDAEVGVVVAHCDDDLSALWQYVSCRRHNVYLYVRCGPAEAAWESVPEGFRHCVSIHMLNDELLHENLGRAHHAYLTHMIDNYDSLNPVTAFIKGSKGFSSRLFNLLGVKTSFWQLGCEKRTCGRKGPIKAGAASNLRQVTQQTIDRFGLRTSVKSGFTMFRSQFAVSRERLRAWPKERFQELKDFVLDPSPEQAACNDPGKCCNCEVLERLWAHLLGCGDEKSAMSIILQEYRPVKWSPVQPRACYSGHGGPVMLLEGQGNLHQQRSAMLSGLYLAALLRWRVLLPQWHLLPDCHPGTGCRAAEQLDFGELLDQQHFMRQAAESLGVEVLEKAPQGYGHLKEAALPCRRTDGCRGTPESLVKMYHHIMGPYLVPPPGPVAVTVSTVKHARAVRLASQAFKHSQKVQDSAGRLLAAARQHGGTLVAVHLHDESVPGQGSHSHLQTSIGRRILSHIQSFAEQPENLTLYIASEGLLSAEAMAHPALRPTLESFPAIRVVDKTDLGVPSAAVPGISPAVDLEVAFQADWFLGTTASTFSALVALERRSRPGDSTAILPGLEDEAICDLYGSQRHPELWQLETSLPYNDCVMENPCSLASSRPRRLQSRTTAESCPVETGFGDNYCKAHKPCWHCSGMTAAVGRCSGTVRDSVRTTMNVRESIPIL